MTETTGTPESPELDTVRGRTLSLVQTTLAASEWESQHGNGGLFRIAGINTLRRGQLAYKGGDPWKGKFSIEEEKRVRSLFGTRVGNQHELSIEEHDMLSSDGTPQITTRYNYDYDSQELDVWQFVEASSREWVQQHVGQDASIPKHYGIDKKPEIEQWQHLEALLAPPEEGVAQSQ